MKKYMKKYRMILEISTDIFNELSDIEILNTLQKDMNDSDHKVIDVKEIINENY
jgi:hypothetical protein